MAAGDSWAAGAAGQFCGGLARVRFTVALDDLKDLFQANELRFYMHPLAYYSLLKLNNIRVTRS